MRRFQRQLPGCRKVGPAAPGAPGVGTALTTGMVPRLALTGRAGAGGRDCFRAPYSFGRENNLTALFLSFCPFKMGKNYSVSDLWTCGNNRMANSKT